MAFVTYYSLIYYVLMKKRHLMNRDDYNGLEGLYPEDYFEEIEDDRPNDIKYQEGYLILFGCVMICVGLVCLFKAVLCN